MELKVQWQEHDLSAYPTIVLTWEDAMRGVPWDYSEVRGGADRVRKPAQKAGYFLEMELCSSYFMFVIETCSSGYRED
jgi:hypothetical protein